MFVSERLEEIINLITKYGKVEVNKLSKHFKVSKDLIRKDLSKLEEQGRMNNLRVTDLRAVKRDNLLRIQAEITNLSPGNQQLYYRFKWLDSDGFTVWEEEPWKPVLIYGNQKQLLNAVSPTFKASDFRLILNSPDNSNP